MATNTLTPSPELYREVRASFVLRYTTLNTWCKEEGIHQTNAKACLIGLWDGPKGKALRARIIEASGMSVSSQIEPENQSTPHLAEATEAEEFFYWGC